MTVSALRLISNRLHIKATRELLHLRRYVATSCRLCGAQSPKHVLPRNGPTFKDFLKTTAPSIDDRSETVPYLNDDNTDYGVERKVHFEVYGCQMNVNDTEIIWSVLQKNGFVKTDTAETADVVLLVTCAIREGAEMKIWRRIKELNALRKRRGKEKTKMKIGILGCMAERLKHNILEKEQAVDLVGGPDSYKDLPRLLALTDNDQKAVNVLLSLDETYADVMPVRLNQDSISAFVSIMRGCDNMCTYCIVPFTRGRERSRPIASIVSEIEQLSAQGVKEVTLLGQNVNSYRDLSETTSQGVHPTSIVKGFRTVYKNKVGGLRFADLLERVADVNPEIRIRFTSPHPKDFPDEVLNVIKTKSNVCKSLHIPAQSGNSDVLERMRRGYTRKAYLDLVDHIRSELPAVTLSSDFIAGFCGETDEEFQDTITMMESVRYNVAFMFAYSMREKTTAHRRFKDDVSEDIKKDRVRRMSEVFRRNAELLNRAQIGQRQLVLVEGFSKRSRDFVFGRNDGNTKVILPKIDALPVDGRTSKKEICPGDYVVVDVIDGNSQVLKGTPLFHTSLVHFYSCINK